LNLPGPGLRDSDILGQTYSAEAGLPGAIAHIARPMAAARRLALMKSRRGPDISVLIAGRFLTSAAITGQSSTVIQLASSLGCDILLAQSREPPIDCAHKSQRLRLNLLLPDNDTSRAAPLLLERG
jgi:hypothetical protein